MERQYNQVTNNVVYETVRFPCERVRRYEPGDVAIVHHGNDGDSGDMVRRLLARLDLTADTVLVVTTSAHPTAAATRSLPHRVHAHDLVSCVTPTGGITLRPLRLASFCIDDLWALPQFTYFLDILCVPKRFLLEQLSFFAADEEQKDKCVVVLACLAFWQFLFPSRRDG